MLPLRGIVVCAVTTVLLFFRLTSPVVGQCETGTFPCLGDGNCVPQHRNCDGHADCIDSSDELNCTDSLESQFWDHLFRKRPTADVDETSSSCELGGNIAKCLCVGLNLLCDHLGFNMVPVGLPPANMLSLVGSHLGNATPTTLSSVPSVRHLILSYAGIYSISTGAFDHLNSLEVLFLDNNNLRKLSNPMFGVKSSVRVLILSHNNLLSLSPDTFYNLPYLAELDLRHNKLERVTTEVLEPLTSLATLYLGDNRLETLPEGGFPPLLQLRTLSLTQNRLSHLESGRFRRLPQLQNLYLSWNQLQFLENGTFWGLHELRSLTLNNNNLKNLESDAFGDLTQLISLDLRGNPLQELENGCLQSLLSLEYIYLQEFSQCSAALHVRVCEPRSDGISSLEHLLASPILRTSAWLIALVACVGNLLVLVGRWLLREPRAAHSLHVASLAMADLLTGIYLLVIASQDRRFRGRYVHVEKQWRSSDACIFCGVVSTVSSQASVLSLTLLTHERLESVTRPLAPRQTTLRWATVTTVCLWATAITVALLPLPVFGRTFYGGNGVCLPLYIHNPFAIGWQYSAFMFMLLNAVALVFIGSSHWRMLQVIRSSTVALRSNQQRARQDRQLAQRFALIVATDCACWLPVMAVKTAALLGAEIPQDLYAWLAVFVLPINSALNPVIYTLTTRLFKQQMYRLLCSWRRCEKGRVSSRQPNPENSTRGRSFVALSITGSTNLHGSWRSSSRMQPSTAV